MPPKKKGAKKAPRPLSPSGRGCGPAEQDHEGPAQAQPDVQGIKFHGPARGISQGG